MPLWMYKFNTTNHNNNKYIYILNISKYLQIILHNRNTNAIPRMAPSNQLVTLASVSFLYKHVGLCFRCGVPADRLQLQTQLSLLGAVRGDTPLFDDDTLGRPVLSGAPVGPGGSVPFLGSRGLGRLAAMGQSDLSLRLPHCSVPINALSGVLEVLLCLSVLWIELALVPLPPRLVSPGVSLLVHGLVRTEVPVLVEHFAFAGDLQDAGVRLVEGSSVPL